MHWQLLMCGFLTIVVTISFDKWFNAWCQLCVLILLLAADKADGAQ